MKQVTPEDHVKPRQALRMRLFWFIAGAGVNYMLIATPFKWLKLHTTMPTWAMAACSMAVSACFFFLWNYFINFRTRRGFRECQTRYLIAVGFCYLLTYSLAMTGIKHWGSSNALTYAIVAACQIGVAGVKFLLYHFWVYPPEAAESSTRRTAE